MREHNRKLRRDKRKNPGKYAKSKKDPGVPNECPFKEKVLQEVEQARLSKQQEKEKRREEAKIKRAAAKAKMLEEKRSGGLAPSRAPYQSVRSIFAPVAPEFLMVWRRRLQTP